MYAETTGENSSGSRFDNRRQSMLVAERLTIREAIRSAIHMKIDKIIVESDSQVAIVSILDKIVAPKQILS